tara:strand:+ start:82 stop:237 length:156 start_codon:yes stop_codon:yes gene_type:complete
MLPKVKLSKLPRVRNPKLPKVPTAKQLHARLVRDLQKNDGGSTTQTTARTY